MLDATGFTLSDDPPDSEPPAKREVKTEDAIAAIFAEKFKDRLRYCHDTGAWFEWDNNTWRMQKTPLAFHWVREICRDVAQDNNSAKVKAVLGKASTAGSVERFARADPALAVTADIWDQDHFLLGTPSGTVDLRTGELRPAMQTDYITKSTSVAPC
jgi:putative DNA primase/helicase